MTLENSTKTYRWQIESLMLQVPSDVDQAHRQAHRGLRPLDVVQLEVSGQTDLAGHRRREAIGKARGKARSLLADLAALRLEPTDDDIADIQADGYLGEVLAELRAGQDGPDGEVARDALALLAGLLDERRAGAAR